MKGNLIYRLPWLVCGQNMKLTLCQVSGPTASLVICWRFGSVLHVVPRQGRLVWHGISPMHISQHLSAIATFFTAVHALLLEAKASSPCTCKWQGTQIGTYWSFPLGPGMETRKISLLFCNQSSSINIFRIISAKGIWSNLCFLPFLPTDVDHWWFCRYRFSWVWVKHGVATNPCNFLLRIYCWVLF